MQFTKPPMSHSQLLKKVKARGLGGLTTPEDEKLFYRTLQRLGYYRLTGYFLAFQQLLSPLDPHKFVPGATFQNVLELHELDTALRNLALEALGKIEVALRTSICEQMCRQHDAHWHLKPSAFATGKHTAVLEEAAKHLDYDLAASKPRIQNPTPNTKAGHLFIGHYYKKYTSPILPPGWMLREVASFGFWARTFDALNAADQKAISNDWLFPDGNRIDHSLLSNWFWSLSILRNRCAHHARITHRQFPFIPNIPTNKSANQCFGVGTKTNDLRTLFIVILILLKNASPNDMWKQKLVNLLERFPHIDMSKATGFSRAKDQNWADLSLFTFI